MIQPTHDMREIRFFHCSSRPIVLTFPLTTTLHHEGYRPGKSLDGVLTYTWEYLKIGGQWDPKLFIVIVTYPLFGIQNFETFPYAFIQPTGC